MQQYCMIKEMPTNFLRSGKENLSVLFHAEIKGGEGGIFLFAKFIQSAAADSPVGGVGRRGQGNGGDFSTQIGKFVYPRRFPADAIELQSLAAQLSSKEIFRAVLAVSPGEHQGMESWMQGDLGQDIPQLYISHPEVGGIDLVS